MVIGVDNRAVMPYGLAMTTTEGATMTKLTEGEKFTTKGITFTEMLFDGRPVAARTEKGNLYTFCRRCGGSGHYSFNLMDGTMCYGCSGAGVEKRTTEEEVVKKAESRRRREAAAARKAEKDRAEAQAALDAWKADHGDLVAALVPHETPFDDQGYTDFDWRPVNVFLTSLADQAKFRPLSPRQVETAKAALARQAGWDAEKAQKNAQRAAAGHLGTVGEKVNVTVTITRVQFLQSERFDRSSSYLVGMQTAEGHELVTFSSGDFGREAEKGQTVAIKGTVKAHGDYKGLPQTVLTRVAKV